MTDQRKAAEKFYREFMDETSIPIMGMASITRKEVIELMDSFASASNEREAEKAFIAGYRAMREISELGNFPFDFAAEHNAKKLYKQYLKSSK